MSVLNVSIEGGVAILEMTAPRVNSLSAKLRMALSRAIANAEENPACRGVMLIGGGANFSAGADISELRDGLGPPLGNLCNQIELLPKPVVAVLHGHCLGGGLELALAAHHRFAARETKIGFPEIKLGLLPGAGGTQRLPRITGAEAALELIVSGKAISADRAAELGIVDQVFDRSAQAAALDFLDDLIAETRKPRRTRDRREGFRDTIAFDSECQTWRSAVAGREPLALNRIVDCVEASLLLPFNAGLEFEATAFADCLASRESKALRHVFFAERRAGRIGREVEPSPLTEIGIVGGGVNGTSLARAVLRAGLPVRLSEQDGYSLEKAEQKIKAGFDNRVARGELSSEERGKMLGRFSADLGTVGLANCSLIIDCTEDDFVQKARKLREIADTVGTEAVIATSTSWLDINALAERIPANERFLALRFSRPAERAKILEIASCSETATQAASTVAQLAKRLRIFSVHVGAKPGFVVGRLLEALCAAGETLVETGAEPYQVDTALRALGFAAGPFQYLDFEGLDKVWQRRQAYAYAAGIQRSGFPIVDKMIEQGWTGLEAGRGYYRYDDARKPRPNRDAMSLVAALRGANARASADITENEIQSVCVDALLIEALRILDAEGAFSAGDIDVAAVHGVGFPRTLGGPMHVAETEGLLAVRARLQARASENSELWTPPPILNRLIREGVLIGDFRA